MPDPGHHGPRRPFRDRFTRDATGHGCRAPHSPGTPPARRRTWTPEQVRALGMTTDLETAASVLGIGRTLAYDLARTGDFPVRLLRLGRRVLVPVASLLEYLGEAPTNDR